MIKNCLICGIEFSKRKVESRKYFETKKYCSYRCYWFDKKGSKRSKEDIEKIKKNHAHWNKDKKFPARSGSNHHNWKGGLVTLICVYCDKEFKVGQYRKDIAKYCSRKCKTDDNLGLTSRNERERKSNKYKQWRVRIFERDNYTCQKCEVRNGNGKTIILNADHIKPFALFPELRFDIDNGITLCDKCHKGTETFGTKLMWAMKQNNLAVVDNI